MPQVKGLAFRSVLQAHASLRGPVDLDRMWAVLEPWVAQSIRTPLASAWYPLASYAALWDAIQKVTYQNPDYPRLVGRRCAEQDLKAVHKLILGALNTTLMLSATSRLFGTYYDTGRCSSKRLDAKTFQFELDGCVGFTVPMWTELRGSIELYVELSTKKHVFSSVVSGGKAGDTGCVFDVSW